MDNANQVRTAKNLNVNMLNQEKKRAKNKKGNKIDF